jgi:hypothetical protein
MSPRRGSTPRLTDRLTVGRNATLTLTLISTVYRAYRVGVSVWNLVQRPNPEAATKQRPADTTALSQQINLRG